MHSHLHCIQFNIMLENFNTIMEYICDCITLNLIRKDIQPLPQEKKKIKKKKSKNTQFKMKWVVRKRKKNYHDNIDALRHQENFVYFWLFIANIHPPKQRQQSLTLCFSEKFLLKCIPYTLQYSSDMIFLKLLKKITILKVNRWTL